MEIVGYVASVLIGVSLGLLGGGGSILTVPVLVYLFSIDPTLATGYSLFIVGATSLIGAIPKYKQGLVSFKTALIFGVPALILVYVIRAFLVPAIPAEIFSIANFVVTKSILTMIMFAVLMVFASVSMIRKKKEANVSENEPQKFNYPIIMLQGAAVGIVAGFVGAGGGFLIIPALVLFSKLPMKKAVGTSLLIIAVNSLIGFLGDITHYQIEWKLLLIITSLAIVGIFAGNWFSYKIPGEKLKKAFGWFVLIMGVYIILKELC